MKRRTFILTAATLGLGALIATATLAHGPGSGWSQGHMQGQGNNYMGHGMGNGMGNGMGQGMMHGNAQGDDCHTNQTLDKPLTIDGARANLEKQLQAHGNDRLKVGKVIDKDDKTIIAEIVTVDDSLVRTIEIDKATGRHNPVR